MLFETFGSGYETLFQVRILHRYFLNVGSLAFDAPAPPAAAQPALAAARRAYDVARFWRIAPDAATRQALRDARLLCRPLPDGFRVAVPTDGGHRPTPALPDELALTFLIYPTDGLFALYTDVAPAVLEALARPTAAAPQGQAFAWSNAAGTTVLNPTETITLADLRPRPAPDGAAGPPLGLLEIRHRPVGGPSLLDGAGRVRGPVLTAVLRNRTTRWEYQHVDLGAFPLVLAGRVAVSGGTPAQPLPNPTPATTADRGAAFVSVIY